MSLRWGLRLKKEKYPKHHCIIYPYTPDEHKETITTLSPLKNNFGMYLSIYNGVSLLLLLSETSPVMEFLLILLLGTSELSSSQKLIPLEDISQGRYIISLFVLLASSLFFLFLLSFFLWHLYIFLIATGLMYDSSTSWSAWFYGD